LNIKENLYSPTSAKNVGDFSFNQTVNLQGISENCIDLSQLRQDMKIDTIGYEKGTDQNQTLMNSAKKGEKTFDLGNQMKLPQSTKNRD